MVDSGRVPDPGGAHHLPTTIEVVDDGVPVHLVRAGALHTFSTNACFKPAIAFPFAISTEGIAGAIASAIGIEDAQVGDPAFDDAHRLASKEPESLKKLLTAEVRRCIVELDAEATSVGSRFRVTDQVRPRWGAMAEEEVLRDIPLCVRVVKTFQAAAKAAGLGRRGGSGAPAAPPMHR